MTDPAPAPGEATTERVRGIFSNIADRYDAFNMLASMGIDRTWRRRLVKACRITPESRVLDLCAGTGDVSFAIADQAHPAEVVVTDFTPEMLSIAEKKAAEHPGPTALSFQLADAQELPFEDGRFDAVVIESVNAFVPDKVKAFGEYARVIRLGGYVAMNEGTWVKSSPPAELLKFIERSMGADFHTAEAWKDYLIGAGLEVTTAKTYRIKALRQRLDENAGLDLSDWMDRMRAIGSFIHSYATDPKLRQYAKTIMPSRAVIRDMFAYLGYGNYVARKP